MRRGPPGLSFAALKRKNMRPLSVENPSFFDTSRYPSAAQLRQLFHSSLDIICSIDLKGRFVHMNDACRKTLGYAPQEMIGAPVASFLEEADIEQTAAIGEAIIRGAAKPTFENRYRRKDGSVVTISWSCQWDAREALMVCIGRDVTERMEKEALQAVYEQKIKEQNRQLNEMLGRMTDAFYALDEDWRIIYANRQCAAMLSLCVEDYLTRNLWEAFPSFVGTLLYEQFHRAVAETVSVHFDIHLPLFDSWYEVNAYPSATGLSVFFRDITEKVKAEQERQRTEAELKKLSLIAKEITNAVSLIERDGTISWINNAYTTIFGYTFEEAFGQKNSELLYGPLSNEATLNKIKGCFYRGEPFRGEIVAYTKSGEPRWFETVGQPLFDEAGRLQRFFLILTDITERRRAEEALLLSNERFRLAAKTDAIYDWDLANNHLAWGEGLAENFGYTAEELQISQWESALHPEDKKGLIADLSRTLDDPGATVWKKEYRLRKKDGAYYCVYERGHILRNSAGTAVRMVGVMQNITERKEAEEELRKLSLVAMHTEDAVTITTPDRKVTWVNEAFTRMTGYTLADMAGKQPATLLEGPGTDKATVRYVREQYKKKVPFQVEILNYRKNGEPFWSEISIQPLLDAAGNVTHYFSMRRETTERKRLAAELEAQRKQTTAAVIAAQEKERSLVSQELHDSVNPVLTTVKLYQDMILADRENAATYVDKSRQLLQESINEIRRLSKRLSVPVKGILALSDSVKELLHSIAETKQFAVCLDTEAIEGWMVPEDLHLGIYRILQEHLTNILKHADASLVTVQFARDQHGLVLDITDDGRGFDTTQKRSGIGISNMLLRAENLNGTLTLKSAPGEGCQMRVVFPVD